MSAGTIIRSTVEDAHQDDMSGYNDAMMSDSSSRSPVEIRLTSWSELCDALVRGLAHALSNRVGALMALVDLESADLSPEERQLLPREIDRLQEINRMLKLLPAEIE